MTNEEFIRNFFIEGTKDKKNRNLSYQNNNLYSYETVIATKYGRTVYINPSKYGQTTTKHTNLVRKIATENNFEIREIK